MGCCYGKSNKSSLENDREESNKKYKTNLKHIKSPELISDELDDEESLERIQPNSGNHLRHEQKNKVNQCSLEGSVLIDSNEFGPKSDYFDKSDVFTKTETTINDDALQKIETSEELEVNDKVLLERKTETKCLNLQKTNKSIKSIESIKTLNIDEFIANKQAFKKCFNQNKYLTIPKYSDKSVKTVKLPKGFKMGKYNMAIPRFYKTEKSLHNYFSKKGKGKICPTIFKEEFKTTLSRKSSPDTRKNKVKMIDCYLSYKHTLSDNDLVYVAGNPTPRYLQSHLNLYRSSIQIRCVSYSQQKVEQFKKENKILTFAECLALRKLSEEDILCEQICNIFAKYQCNRELLKEFNENIRDVMNSMQAVFDEKIKMFKSVDSLKTFKKSINLETLFS